jgi:quinol monooxygenase YgiN
MSVIYEVNLAVDPDVAEAFADWLPQHIAEMLTLPGFIRAESAIEFDPQSDPTKWCVRYHLSNQAALEAYFRNHAERMRAEGVKHFGTGLAAHRRILLPKTEPA